jgi:hypothetical protein
VHGGPLDLQLAHIRVKGRVVDAELALDLGEHDPPDGFANPFGEIMPGLGFDLTLERTFNLIITVSLSMSSA